MKFLAISLLLAPVLGAAISSTQTKRARRGGPARGRGPPVAVLPPWGSGPAPGVRPGPPPFVTSGGGPPWARWGSGGPPGWSGSGTFFWCEDSMMDQCYFYDGDIDEYYYCDDTYCYAYDYDYWCDWDGYCYDYNYDSVDIDLLISDVKEGTALN